MKHISKKYVLVIAASIPIIALLAFTVFYPLHIRKQCAIKAERYESYTKDGEFYLIAKGVPSIKLSTYTDICMSKHGL